MKMNSNLKRWLKQLGIGALIGAPLGFLLGYLGLLDKPMKVNEQVVVDSLNLLGNSGLLISLILSAYLIYRIVQTLKAFEAEADDEVSDDLYRLVNRQHGYAMVATGVGAVLGIALLALNYKILVAEDAIELVFSGYAILGLLIFAGLQMYLLKLYNRLRGSQVPLLPTLKELENNILQQDEAELEANHKMAFDIVLKLSNVILPALYLLVLAVGLLTQTNQVLAIIVLAVIHLYIMVRNLKMIRQFYR